MAKFQFVEWLMLWLQQTVFFRFEWDKGNLAKSSAKHSVSPEETEEVFVSRQVAPLGIQISPRVEEERLGIVGATFAGRILHIVFTIRAGKVRPISARPAKRKERRFYEAYLREGTKGI